eukprot:TRINITY_DN67416_c0_g1_i1.p1 TRINITY_DN67416_c0_g1~~TRINITY_DN67416_c0_g1_i1.p1  ORF type:complete len:756 (+),score=121.71 TRINITY_DN67416_c0_g1_i1:125-2269(+)
MALWFGGRPRQSRKSTTEDATSVCAVDKPVESDEPSFSVSRHSSRKNIRSSNCSTAECDRRDENDHQDSRASILMGVVISLASQTDLLSTDFDDEHIEEIIASVKPSPRKLLSLANQEAHLLIPGLCFMLSFVFVDLALPILVGRAINIAVAKESYRMNLNVVMIVLLASKTIAVALNAAGNFAFGIASERVSATLRHRLFEAIVRQDIAILDVQQTGDLLFRLNTDVTVVQEAITRTLADSFCSVTKMVLNCVAVFLISWKLALVTFAILPMITVFLVPLIKVLSRIEGRCQTSLSKASSFSQERIANIKLVRSFAAEQHEMLDYAAVLGMPVSGSPCCWWPKPDGSVLRLCTVRAVIVSVGFSGLAWLASIGLCVVLVFGLHLVAQAELSLGDLMSFLLLCASLGFRASIVSSSIPKVLAGLTSSLRVFEFIDRVPTISTEEGGVRPDIFEGVVTFEDVHFAYPSRASVQILDGLSFRVPANTMAAFVGSSGAGKSTVLVLLERFYDTTSGAVRVDGYDIRELDPLWLRQRIIFVHQEPVLFAMSVRENICYGVTAEQVNVRRALELPDADIQRACEQANAWNFIQNLPQGLDSFVGERGKHLSGGQRQRVAIARALIVNPRILLLDEATSALDAESEELVQEALSRAKSGRTMIAVAHRLSTIVDADQIHMMRQGALVDVGSHSELMERCDEYRELVERQLGSKHEQATSA